MPVVAGDDDPGALERSGGAVGGAVNLFDPRGEHAARITQLERRRERFQLVEPVQAPDYLEHRGRVHSPATARAGARHLPHAALETELRALATAHASSAGGGTRTMVASMQGGGVGRIEDDRLPAGRGLDAREAVGDRIDPLIRRAYAGRGSPVGLG